MRPLLLVGLGNPGAEYVGTRHNLGDEVLGVWVAGAAPEEMLVVDVLHPTTFMNASGRAVVDTVRKSRRTLEDVLLIHDDLELPLGEVRLVREGSAQGHNGVRSIHQALQSTAIPRLRLGVGRPPAAMTVRDFVLQRFAPEERVAVQAMTGRARTMISDYIKERAAPT